MASVRFFRESKDGYSPTSREGKFLAIMEFLGKQISRISKVENKNVQLPNSVYLKRYFQILAPILHMDRTPEIESIIDNYYSHFLAYLKGEQLSDKYKYPGNKEARMYADFLLEKCGLKFMESSSQEFWLSGDAYMDLCAKLDNKDENKPNRCIIS